MFAYKTDSLTHFSGTIYFKCTVHFMSYITLMLYVKYDISKPGLKKIKKIGFFLFKSDLFDFLDLLDFFEIWYIDIYIDV